MHTVPEYPEGYIYFFKFSLFPIQQHLTTKSMCIFVCFIDELDRTCPVETKSQSEEIQGGTLTIVMLFPNRRHPEV